MSRAWMPLYVADYLADTGHLTTAEHGAYLLLIMHYWSNGGLPDDERKLARIARMTPDEWAEARDTVAELFQDGWKHKRIEKELIDAQAAYERRSKAGKDGARAKWGEGAGTTTRSERLVAARKIAKHTPEEWHAMQHIFGGCVKCGISSADLHGEECTKDHIIPVFKGGSDGIENIQPLCRQCNSSKSADGTDYRDSRIKDWRERLANACQTHGKRMANAKQSQSQSHIDTNVSIDKREPTALAVLSECMSEQTARDLIAHRQKLRKPLTARAAKLLAKDFVAYGKPEEAAEMMIKNGWQGFHPTWVANQTARAGPPANGRGGMASLLAKSLGLKNGRESRDTDEAVHVLPVYDRAERGNVSDDGGQLPGDIIDLLAVDTRRGM